jgi:hypothetical protein
MAFKRVAPSTQATKSRSRFERVRVPTTEEKIRPESPLRPENEHLIGGIIQFNDVFRKYHLATIRGVVECRPNDIQSRQEIEVAIRKDYGPGPVNWDDVWRNSRRLGFGSGSRTQKLARIENSSSYHGFFWVVTGMLERDMHVDENIDGGIYTYTHFLLQPTTFALWVASPAVAPESF